MIPEAKSEIASGRNSTSLKAAAHLIRCVSTANISPRLVAKVGATSTQIMLFFSAIVVRRSLKTSA
jgi:hypothetical protein